MDNLHSWLLEKKQKEMILDSSKTKEAVNYCLNRWENLENFIKYPEATFSTNAAERSVKSWVMARRNFLFSGSGNGARASCFILSLIETAKQNGIAPEDYLRCLFKKPLMLKLKMTGKNFSPGILKLLHIRFVENGFKLWYNYVNVNSICGYDQNCTSCKCPCGHRFRHKIYFPLVCLLCLR